MLIRLPLAVLALLACISTAAFAKGPVYTDPTKTDADFAFQGEYAGEITTDDGPVKIGVQVIALGDGKFHAVGYIGGLPGDGYSGEPKVEADGELQDGAVVFRKDEGRGVVRDGVLKLIGGDDNEIGQLNKVERKSETLGAKPPQGANVLFDGKSADGFKNAKVEDGLLVQGTASKQNFGSQQVHLEFRTPYAPHERGQGRGNSGVYLQGRYEVQVLDSFGLSGEQNECGGLYSVAKPKVNMCFPPLTWQTYDIDYTAGQFDANGKVVKNPRVTVRHNGVLIHDDVELPGERNTTAAPVKAGPEDGPLYLQDHGNPVRYRNIWVVEKK
jgi:hypothetical protein